MALPDSRTATPRIRTFDQQRAEAAIRELLFAIGEDPEQAGFAGHSGPRRSRLPRDVRRALHRPRLGAEHHVRRRARRAGDSQGNPAVLHLRAPSGVVPRCGPCRLHPRQGRQGDRTVEDRPAGRPLRQAATGAGAAHQPDRRRPDEQTGSARGDRRRSRPSTCAWRCAVSASPVPSRRRRRCAVSSKPTPLLEPKRSTSSCVSESTHLCRLWGF